nr:MAG TPA: hypothetical protein [Caudoviricetes sp.]DAU78485.1 MAG TPA: hypothetical protein [Caudoviricetes sp.]
MMENVNCLRCRFRHEDNGNCTAVGGFCTAVAASHCPLLREYLDTGLTPEEVLPKDKADEIALKLMQLSDLESICSYTRLRELAEADKDGRLLVLPSNKALTNADRIRAATNQQLAKLLYDNQKEFCRLMYKNLGFEDELNFSEDYSDILAWLNAPSKEADAALEAMKDE